MKKQTLVKQINVNANKLPLTENVAVLKHILSPLELSAWDNQYQAFTYHLNEIPININLKEAKAILKESKKRMETFSAIIQKTSSSLLKGNVKQKRNFIESFLTEHQLPVQGTRTLQQTFNCKTIYDILRIGKEELSLKKGISKAFLKQLETLIAKHHCSHLF